MYRYFIQVSIILNQFHYNKNNWVIVFKISNLQKNTRMACMNWKGF